VSDFELPVRLVQAAKGDDARLVRRGVAGIERGAWIAELPSVVEDLVRRWSLEVGRPFQPGGVASWVAPARGPAGEHLVLKVGWRHDEATHEADGLRAWNGDGVVQLVDAVVVGESSALLLEACEPGTTLSEVPSATVQDAVAAGLLRRLWIEPAPGHPFRTLGSMCAWWADEYEEKYRAATGGPRLDPGLSRAGIELLRGLPGSATRRVLLCTDLHPRNVLASGREPWLVIDPKPYVGDPTYDPIQHMLNFPDRLSVDPAGFARRVAALVDLDAERLRQWLFARCVQESLDQPRLMTAAITLAP
jgi:streptomycin 6-kinase